jgi:signal transduction histidine kinase
MDSPGSMMTAEFFQRAGRPAVVIGSNRRLLMANDSAVKALGISRGYMPGLRLEDLPWPDDQLSMFTRSLDQAMGGEKVNGTMAFGRGRTIEFEIIPISEQDEDIGSVILSFEDITERSLNSGLAAAIDEVYREMLSDRSPEDVIQRVSAKAGKALDADAIGICMREGEDWVVRYATGRLDRLNGTRLSGEQARKAFPVLVSGRAEHLDGLPAVECLDPKALALDANTCLLAVPVMVKGEAVALLLFGHFDRPVEPRQVHIDFANKVGTGLSLALESSARNASLNEWRELLQAVIESSPSAIALLKAPDLEVMVANRAFFRCMQDRTSPTFAPGQLRDMIVQMVEEVQKEGEQKARSDFTIDTDDGRKRWNFTFTPMSDGRSVLLVAHDVTALIEEKRRLEELVKKDEERVRLRAVLDAMPVGILVSGADGRTVEGNEAGDLIWGGKADRPTGLDDFSRLSGRWTDTGLELKKGDWPVVRAIRNSEVVQGAVIDLQRNDGAIGTAIFSAALVRDQEGKPLGAVSVMQDITAQRRLEHEAVEAKHKTELYLDVLSHDISNLDLAAISYLEMYMAKETVSAKGRRHLENTEEMLGEISGLIENVRKLQEVESTGGSHSMIDLQVVLDEVAGNVSRTPGREVTVENAYGPPMMIMANELVTDLFSNLLNNAVKYSSDPVLITIREGRTFRDGREYHRVEVEDKGSGIPDELKPKLFTSFVRGKTKAQCKGLGLYLVKRIAEEFGGDVWAEDRVPGDHTKGAKFVVLLPVASVSSAIDAMTGDHLD